MADFAHEEEVREREVTAFGDREPEGSVSLSTQTPAMAHEARVAPVSLELVLEVRRLRFKKCLEATFRPATAFADVVNENWSCGDDVIACNAVPPAEGGNK